MTGAQNVLSYRRCSAGISVCCPQPRQTRLSYFVDCIDFPARRDEIDHPMKQIGSRDLMEQLAPRINAKAPRMVFVGSP
jgi:hypothetical protein